MRLAPVVLAGYLLLTLVPLLSSHPDGLGAALALGHLGLAALFLRHARRGDGGRVVFLDWLPVLLVPLLYLELALLNHWLVPGYLDATVQGWERTLFGVSPSTAWAGAMPHLLLSEVLHVAYLSYYPLIYLPQLPHHLRGRPRAFHTTLLGLVLAFTGCYLVFTVFPVQGPRYLTTPEGIPHGPFRDLTLAILGAGSSRGTAFPSSHVAVAVVQGAMAVRFHGARGWWLVVLAVLLAGGAVYGGFHYAIDVVVGALVGLAAAWAALRLGPSGGGGSA